MPDPWTAHYMFKLIIYCFRKSVLKQNHSFQQHTEVTTLSVDICTDQSFTGAKSFVKVKIARKSLNKCLSSKQMHNKYHISIRVIDFFPFSPVLSCLPSGIND